MVTTKPFTFPHSRFIGFDHIWDEIERLSKVANANEKGFPRHNVVKTGDDSFVLELALAGFKEENLTVELNKPGLLIVRGESGDDGREYLHKGITTKKFTETFRLDEHVVVEGAEFTDGMLVIKLKVELPEEQRPRLIEIKTKGDASDEEG